MTVNSRCARLVSALVIFLRLHTGNSAESVVSSTIGGRGALLRGLQPDEDCSTGNEFDSLIDECVAVSCEAEDACPVDEYCIPDSVVCARNPCPQFVCIEDCPEFKDYDSSTYECVAVECGATDACPINELCVSTDRVCDAKSPACPQFDCIEDCPEFFEYDPSSFECVPVSCEAPDACATDEVCVSTSIVCTLPPCPQFVCEKQCPEFYELDPLTSECVAVECGATDACAVDELCISESIVCTLPPCPQLVCIEDCPEFYEYDPLTNECLAVDCGATDACPIDEICVTTRIVCVRPPCPQFVCEEGCPEFYEFDPLTSECLAVECGALDACSVDEVCVTTSIVCVRPPCPQFVCEEECPEFYEHDPLTNECVAVECGALNACSVDQICVTTSIVCVRPPCPQFVCIEECPEFYEYDPLTNECLAVECGALDACSVDEVCVTTSIVCARQPCPQFVCEEGCPEFYEYDPLTNDCVAVLCEASDACLPDELCISESLVCVRPPCPQFDCVEDCPEFYDYDPVAYECVAVSCEASDACLVDEICVSESSVCAQQPCPQFDCIEDCPEIYEYDAITYKCVPVSCEATDACLVDELCISESLVCVGPPCPQFLCIEDCPEFYEYDPLTYECVASECGAPDACPIDELCIFESSVCAQPPCPQFDCIEDCPESLECNPLTHECVSPCELPKEIGPCDGAFPSWFFNTATSKCDQFIYGGCEGNGNRFDTKQDCQENCLVKDCPELYEYDLNINDCVPVSCEASDACPQGENCFPTTKVCVAALGIPCPQFECCPEFYEYDSRPNVSKCVPVDCGALDACPEGKTCFPKKSKNKNCDNKEVPCIKFKCKKDKKCKNWRCE